MKPARLVPVGVEYDAAYVLYELLAERRPEENISHRRMPSWEEHKDFMASQPYDAWYLIKVENALPPVVGDYVGAIYLTAVSEIGVGIFRSQRGHGYAREAIIELMRLHPRKRYLANINPKNETSIRFFSRLGFHHIQNTYELAP